MSMSAIALTILALYAAGISAGALTAMWPPFLQVFSVLTNMDMVDARRFVGSVSLIFGGVAVLLFAIAMGLSS